MTDGRTDQQTDQLAVQRTDMKGHRQCHTFKNLSWFILLYFKFWLINVCFIVSVPTISFRTFCKVRNSIDLVLELTAVCRKYLHNALERHAECAGTWINSEIYSGDANNRRGRCAFVRAWRAELVTRARQPQIMQNSPWTYELLVCR